MTNDSPELQPCRCPGSGRTPINPQGGRGTCAVCGEYRVIRGDGPLSKHPVVRPRKKSRDEAVIDAAEELDWSDLSYVELAGVDRG
jgi:hypothetical protein